MRFAFLLLFLGLVVLGADAARGDAPETVTLTRAQIDQLEQQAEALIVARERAAFQAGRADAKQRCASLI